MTQQTCRLVPYRLGLLLLLALPLTARADHMINDVRVENPGIDLLAGSAAAISWTLAEPGTVTLRICDINGNIVRTLVDKQQLEDGSHTVQWEGLYADGSPVVNGLYFPIIQGKSPRKGTSTYNPSSMAWGEDVSPMELNYDADRQTLSFGVARMTYGRLRVGLKEGGPVYRTLAPWQLWQPGQHEIPWNGKDAAGLHTVMDQAELSYSFDAFALPENSLIVMGAPQADSYDQRQLQKFPVHPPSGAHLSYFSVNPGSQGAEPELAVAWQQSSQQDGLTLLRGKASCLVSFADPNKEASSLQGGSELILYLDDTYVVEVPVEELPALIGFDTTGFDNGAHTVTINLLTADDRAGISLHKVSINN